MKRSVQRSPPARSTNGKFRGRRPDQTVAGADLAQKIERGAIAGQQKMIAVVDHHADRGVVIGAAAAAGKSGRFVHDHGFAARAEFERGGETGKTGADNVDGACHQTRLRNTMKRNFARGKWTFARGGANPRAISAVENEPIGLAHDARRPHHAARVLRHDRARLVELRRAPARRSRAQGFAIAGCASTVAGSVAVDARRQQVLARQIKPAHRGVLVEVAQDIGELQRAAEMMGERRARLLRSMPNTRTDSRPTAQATRSQ